MSWTSVGGSLSTVPAMEITKLFGLPAHPLLVHAPIVLVPLAALVAIALVVVPGWRARFGWAFVGLTGLALAGVQLAMASGEGLEEHVEETRVLERHTEMASSMRPLAVALFVVAVAFVWFDGRRRSAGAADANAKRDLPIVPVLAVLLVLVSVAATARLAQVGHNGAKASWEDVPLDRSREHDEDDD